MKKIIVGIAVWMGIISAAHLSLNVDWDVLLNDRLPDDRRKLNVGYIPVT
jgi:hypothetical protein